jgi:hypothetical protein
MSNANERDEEGDVPEGAAVFPAIPPELGVNPLLLAAVHAVVFLAGSDEGIVHPEAGDEAVQQMAEYLQRLEGADLRRVQEDMACLTAFARQQKWPRGLVQSLKSFLADIGVEPEGEE